MSYICYSSYFHIENQEDVNISKKILLILLISIIAICTVSAVSAQDLNDTVIADDYNLSNDIEYDPFTVGGPCDIVEEQSQSSCNVTFVLEKIPAEIQIKQSGEYYGDKKLTVKVINNTKASLYPVPVTLKFSNGKSATVVTDSKGAATYTLPFNPGKYSVKASISSNYLDVKTQALKNIIVKKADAKITLKKLTTSFGAKKYFEVKLTNVKTKKGIGDVKLLVKVYTGKKVKKIYLTTNSKGIAKYNAAGLDVGVHKVKVSEVSGGVSAKAKTSQITVKKASTTFLDEVDAIYIKKAKTYNIALFNKNNEKVIKGIKIHVKIYDDKKSYTYDVKTGRYGSEIDISHLGLGSYKVVVTFDGNSRYLKCTGRGDIDIIRSAGQVIF